MDKSVSSPFPFPCTFSSVLESILIDELYIEICHKKIDYSEQIFSIHYCLFEMQLVTTENES